MGKIKNSGSCKIGIGICNSNYIEMHNHSLLLYMITCGPALTRLLVSTTSARSVASSSSLACCTCPKQRNIIITRGYLDTILADGQTDWLTIPKTHVHSAAAAVVVAVAVVVWCSSERDNQLHIVTVIGTKVQLHHFGTRSVLGNGNSHKSLLGMAII